MRKRLVVFLFLLSLCYAVTGQQKELVVKGYGKDLHIDHVVSPKEGIFSIGRIYNVHPKAIASYNKLDMSKGLSVGQVIHIPLTDTNFSQKSNKGKPIYYTAGAKETLEKISNVYNKVPIQNLREWNKLSKDDPAAGKKLIIGFLVANEAAATVQTEKKEEQAKDTTTKLAAVKTTTGTNNPALKDEKVKEDGKKAQAEKKEEQVKDTITKQVAVKTNTGRNKPALKDEKLKEDSKKVQPVTAKAATTNKDTLSKQPVAKTNTDPVQPPKQEQKTEEQKKPEATIDRPSTVGNMTGTGYFKSSFEQQVKTKPNSKTETVTAGIFRMTNGPGDSKYYMLIDGIPSGTIVKVVNPDNNKAIYAKVLGEMSGIRQNQGLNLRISNAAASMLDISDTDKFIVKINY